MKFKRYKYCFFQTLVFILCSEPNIFSLSLCKILYCRVKTETNIPKAKSFFSPYNLPHINPDREIICHHTWNLFYSLGVLETQLFKKILNI